MMPNPNQTETKAAVADVLTERKKQDQKWGEQNHDPILWIAILTEEVGELAQAALHHRFGGHRASGLREEAVQVAAVALAIVECLDRNKVLSASSYSTREEAVAAIVPAEYHSYIRTEPKEEADRVIVAAHVIVEIPQHTAIEVMVAADSDGMWRQLGDFLVGGTLFDTFQKALNGASAETAKAPAPPEPGEKASL